MSVIFAPIFGRSALSNEPIFSKSPVYNVTKSYVSEISI